MSGTKHTGPTQITPNLFVVERGANIFILKVNDTELVLIDTGIPGSCRLILDAVKQLGYTPDAIKHILITHADFDHVGSLHGLREATGAQVYAGEKSVPYIESATAPPHVPFLLSLLTRPFQMLTQKKARVDHPVADGDVLDIAGGIQVLHTPGHTEDNVCYLWQQENILFAPDLLGNLSGIGLMPAMITWDVTQARISAKRVLDLEPAIIGVGHGPTVIIAESEAEVAAFRESLRT
ncbi:MAG: MBL fold metallo-hydrolase [Chloroflexota bacterium]